MYSPVFVPSGATIESESTIFMFMSFIFLLIFLQRYGNSHINKNKKHKKPRVVYGEINSVKNTTINIWLNDGVY